MKQPRLILFFLFLLQFSLAKAQSPFGEAKDRFTENIYFIELTGGTIIPSYNFSGTSLENTDRSLLYNQTEALSFRTQFCRHFSFSPRLSYDVKGGSFPKYKDVIIKSHYLSLLTPIEFNGYFSEKMKITKPGWLLYMGPYVSYSLGGALKNKDIEYELTAKAFNDFDAGFEAGIGIRIPTFSFTGMGNFTIKAAFYHGFVNTYPDKITTHIKDFDGLMFAENGKRYNMGLRLTLSYEIALLKKEVSTYTAGGDGKSSYKKFIIK